tara:strand:+ start:2081 stop:2344 length:264 start_codon:yes stop_codon:yes gene_type:complete
MAYIGKQHTLGSLASLDGVQVKANGLSQKKDIDDNVVVPADESVVYFGSTKFKGSVTVNGDLIISHGNPDFIQGVSVTGNIYVETKR